MRNLRLADDTYEFIFLGCSPKTTYGTNEVIPGQFKAKALMIDPFIGGEDPELISVAIDHHLDDFEVGQKIFFQDLTCSLYRLETHSGLSWKAVRAGTSDDIFEFQNGVMA